jgi:hypothetical protein
MEAALANIGLWIVATVLINLSPAHAAEVCVSCAEPAARYRCVLADGEGRPVNDAALQVLCIKELAARGQHARCSFDRTRANEPCDAPVAAVTLPAGLAANPSDSASAGPKSAAVPVPAPAVTRPAVADKQPPKTMEELAKVTAEQSKADWQKANTQVKETTEAAGRQVEKAGTAVGSAVKKTWDCMASFFSKC